VRSCGDSRGMSVFTSLVIRGFLVNMIDHKNRNLPFLKLKLKPELSLHCLK